MIRVLIADDSKTERELLTRIINSDDTLEVVCSVGDGESAIQGVKRYKPDLVILDLQIQKTNGIEVMKEIMGNNPVPIIVVTNSYDSAEAQYSFKALEAGALMVVKRPVGLEDLNYEKEKSLLIKHVKLMSEIKVVRRVYTSLEKVTQWSNAIPKCIEHTPIRVIAIGGSTGGTAVIGRILSGLSPQFHIPILIVQHMTVGFTKCFCDWLCTTSHYSVSIAEDGELIMPGKAYLAPDDYHMTVTSGQHILLLKEKPENGLRPSVNYLFTSVADQYGPSALGILLTGMGSDGALGLLKMMNRGGITVAQDHESSIVYGMPGDAVKKGAVQYSLDPDSIVELMKSLK